MLLIYEAIEVEKIKWDDIVTVSDHAASMGGSQIFLEPMEQQTVRDLTKAIVVASGNDAAVAMAEFIAGSEEGFVILMNERAKKLGMNNTNFKNACGLDEEGHFSSAYDISIMTRQLTLNHPQVFEFSKIWMDTIIHKTARGSEEFGLSNTNRLIKAYSGATGLKTGSTSEALYCISATASRDNLDLIAVILGAPNPSSRFHEAMRMFDFGFATYALTLGDAAGTEKTKIKVYKGDLEEVSIAVKTQVNCLIPKGKNVVMESKIELLETLYAPVEKGTKAGEIIYYSEGSEVGRSDLITVAEVNKASLKHVMDRLIENWI
jgi:serine-type D-Ala-D-Ala carboxypeptidase (penicillin-binding protein 5/6)